jgi:hypothetical protein
MLDRIELVKAIGERRTVYFRASETCEWWRVVSVDAPSEGPCSVEIVLPGVGRIWIPLFLGDQTKAEDVDASGRN